VIRHSPPASNSNYIQGGSDESSYLNKIEKCTFLPEVFCILHRATYIPVALTVSVGPPPNVSSTLCDYALVFSVCAMGWQFSNYYYYSISQYNLCPVLKQTTTIQCHTKKSHLHSLQSAIPKNVKLKGRSHRGCWGRGGNGRRGRISGRSYQAVGGNGRWGRTGPIGEEMRPWHWFSPLP